LNRHIRDQVMQEAVDLWTSPGSLCATYSGCCRQDSADPGARWSERGRGLVRCNAAQSANPVGGCPEPAWAVAGPLPRNPLARDPRLPQYSRAQLSGRYRPIDCCGCRRHSSPGAGKLYPGIVGGTRRLNLSAAAGNLNKVSESSISCAWRPISGNRSPSVPPPRSRLHWSNWVKPNERCRAFV